MVARASSGSARFCPLGPARGGGGEGGGRARRAERGGERTPAEAAVLIPATRRSSARRASQMACPALGLEALQPLQPEPPPEPAFAEAQKWIEVGAAAGGRPCRDDRSCCPGLSDRRSSLPPLSWPPSPGHPLWLPADCDPLVLEPRDGGREQGTLRSSCAPRGRRRSPAPSSLLPTRARNLGSVCKCSHGKRSASRSAAKGPGAQSLQSLAGVSCRAVLLSAPHFIS